MKKLRIFLTGSSGFIGKNIHEKLKNKYDFTAPSHKLLNLLDARAVDNYFKKRGIVYDVVAHCAFIGGPRKATDSPETLNENLRIFFNLERNKKYFKKFINLGSGAEYGKQNPLVRVSENDFDKVVPQNSDYYGFAKYIISKYIENSRNFVNLRLFGIYGPYEDASLRFISYAICRSIFKMPISINKNVYFEYLYINDFVRIFEYFLANKPNFKSYNVGRGESVDLVTIANRVNKIAPYKSQIQIKSKGIAFEYSCKNTRLLKEIGSFNFTNFDDSLTELYRWYFKRKSTLNKKLFEFDQV